MSATNASPRSLLLGGLCEQPAGHGWEPPPRLARPLVQAAEAETPASFLPLTLGKLVQALADVVRHFKLREVLGMGVGVGAYLLTQLAAENPSVSRGRWGQLNRGALLPAHYTLVWLFGLLFCCYWCLPPCPAAVLRPHPGVAVLPASGVVGVGVGPGGLPPAVLPGLGPQRQKVLCAAPVWGAHAAGAGRGVGPAAGGRRAGGLGQQAGLGQPAIALPWS